LKKKEEERLDFRRFRRVSFLILRENLYLSFSMHNENHHPNINKQRDRKREEKNNN